MIRNLRVLSSLLALTAIPLVGCQAEVRTAPVQGEVVVESPPPPPPVQVEVVPPPPSAEVVWVGGYHRWDGARYVWVGGRYERPARPGARWEGAHWEARGRGRVWIEGRWR